MLSRKKAQSICFFLALFVISSLNPPVKSIAAAAKHVVGTVWYSDNTVKVYVDPAQTVSRPKYKYNMLDGNRFYIDIFNSRISSNLDALINLDDVLAVRRAQNNTSTSRVVIHFNKSGIKPTVTYKTSPKPHFLIAWASSSTSSNREKFRILIDPGHGGRDAGATGPIKKMSEKVINLDVALKLEQLLLERDDVIVELTRRTDIEVKLSERREKARKWKPDIFISIHVNSSEHSKSLNQTEIYYYDRKSLPLAQIVRDELIDELERSGGKIHRKGFEVIRNNPARYGSVLVESCYISSRQGENYLSQDWYRQEIAKGLRNSIDAFLNLDNINN
ncbi:hypothetical protein AMJ80_05400 [bacterium SM23_31]|nr:MAG: hypothetical protein AMJ80_05400 [bacterium SM23_31]